eukprot:4430036-Prymnesium_polylepis.1
MVCTDRQQDLTHLCTPDSDIDELLTSAFLGWALTGVSTARGCRSDGPWLLGGSFFRSLGSLFFQSFRDEKTPEKVHADPINLITPPASPPASP